MPHGIASATSLYKMPPEREALPKTMQLVAGRTAQEYNMIAWGGDKWGSLLISGQEVPMKKAVNRGPPNLQPRAWEAVLEKRCARPSVCGF